MPHEKGGRADKLGNRYEVLWCFYKIIQVLEEKLVYVSYEPVGEFEQGVDVLICDRDGIVEGQQCKSRNGSKEYWDFGSINAREISKKWKRHLERDRLMNVSMVSPLAFSMLEDLTGRARNTKEDSNTFYDQRILGSSKEFVTFCNNICVSLSLECGTNVCDADLVNFLRRIKYHQVGDSYLKELVQERINFLFSDENALVFSAFIEWITSGEIFGFELRIVDIIEFVDKNGFTLKDLTKDKKILPKVKELNARFDEEFTSFETGYIDRDVTEKCIKEILEENSIIIHGGAGVGKSGVTIGILDYCKQNRIPYLALKLDMFSPRINVEKWSKDIGFSTSLVHSFDSVSKGKNAVLILDQLDALRWTIRDSKKALSVCSELIRSVTSINKDRKFKISIVFVCRTYDFRNDNNILSLFSKKKDTDILWSEVEVLKLDDNEVKVIVGDIFDEMSSKLKKLLYFPSNLYIWQQIASFHPILECNSTYQLVSQWWELLENNCEDSKVNVMQMKRLRDQMVNIFESTGRVSVYSSEIKVDKSAAKYLVSNGFLNQTNQLGSNLCLSFAHQSLYDCFIAENMFNSFLSNESMISIVGEKGIQTPTRRYQLQIFLQNLYELEEDEFIRFGKKFVTSDKVRFSYKYIFFEILNQISNPSASIFNTVVELVNMKDLRLHILSTVLPRNGEFIDFFCKDGIFKRFVNENEEDKVIGVLQTVSNSFTLSMLELIEKHILSSEKSASKWLRCFSYDILDDSKDTFNLRMKVYRKYPLTLDTYFNISALMRGQEKRVIDIIELIYVSKSKLGKRINYYDDLIEDTGQLIIENGEYIVEKFITLIPTNEESDMEWVWYSKHNKSIERSIVNILIKALIAVINSSPEKYIEYIKPYMGKGYQVHNEIILSSMLNLPSGYSNVVIGYLVQDMEKNMLIKNDEIDQLRLAKEVLQRHLKQCSQKVTQDFLNKVYYFMPSRAKDYLKTRIEFNRKKDYPPVYWSFWGDFQNELYSSLPDELLDRESFELKRVLKRRFENERSRYDRTNWSRSGSVVSPVFGKELSEKSWLDIITSDKIRAERTHGDWSEEGNVFVDRSVKSFGSSLSDMIASNPRILTKIEKIEKTIYPDLVESIFFGMSKCEKLEQVPLDVIEALIMKYAYTNESIDIRICEILSKYSSSKLTTKLITIIDEFASKHPDPNLQKEDVYKPSDETRTSEVLVSNAYNSVRGSALITIGSLMSRDKDYFNCFKQTIEERVNDEVPAVRYACLRALLPSLRIDKAWSSDLYIKLFSLDENLLVFNQSSKVLLSLYSDYSEEVKTILMKGIKFDDRRIQNTSFDVMLEIYLQYGSGLDDLKKIDKDIEEYNSTITQVIAMYFRENDFFDRVNKLIIELIDRDFNIESLTIRLLNDRAFELPRDDELLYKMLLARPNDKVIKYFSEYLTDTGYPIKPFSDLVLDLCKSVVVGIDNSTRYWYIDEISKMVIWLYDETCNSQINEDKKIAFKCLNVWDIMFEKQLGSARKLSFELMER